MKSAALLFLAVLTLGHAAAAAMAWNHTAIGSDLHISAVRIGIETLETVPEPSTPVLIGSLGLLSLLRRRK